MYNVEDRIDLKRDPASGAIINVDFDAYMASVTASKNRQVSKKQLEDNTNDINSIKEEVSEIKDMMKQLLNRLIDDGR
jgi:hypothetical protein